MSLSLIVITKKALPLSKLMSIAVIITTYNRPDALVAVLEGYLAQCDRGFELVVADDGSTDETRTAVETYRTRAWFKLSHVWHEDQGFRAAAIRNRALATTNAQYIIFTDGDCVPTPGFVAQHRRLAEPVWFLSGNRVLLSRGFTRTLLEKKLPVHQWNAQRWLRAYLRRDINRWLPLVSLPDGGFRKLSPAKWKGVKTCNLSAWRRDLLAVNGFDEAYSGWGLEDSDLVVRLLRAGIRHKNARFAAPVFHLWHPKNERTRLANNQRQLDEVLHCERTRATVGVGRYL
jgi:Glycosyltransferases involved in cell wall biogenesis